MKYNYETPLLIKIIQIIYWKWEFKRGIKAYKKKERRIWRVRMRSQRRAGVYMVMRAETRRENNLSSDKLRIIA